MAYQNRRDWLTSHSTARTPLNSAGVRGQHRHNTRQKNRKNGVNDYARIVGSAPKRWLHVTVNKNLHAYSIHAMANPCIPVCLSPEATGAGIEHSSGEALHCVRGPRCW